MERAISQILSYTLIKIHPKWHVVDPNSLHSKLLNNRNLNKKNTSHKRILIRKLLHNVTYSQVIYFAKHGFLSPSLNCKNYYYYYCSGFKMWAFCHQAAYKWQLLTTSKNLVTDICNFCFADSFPILQLVLDLVELGTFFLMGFLPHQRLVTDICPLLSYGV